MLLTEKIKNFFKSTEKKNLSSVVDPARVVTDLENDANSNLGIFYYDTYTPTNGIERFFKYNYKSEFDQLIWQQRQKILKYREISAYSEVFYAISIIVNEIIFAFDDESPIKLDINEENEKLKERLNKEFLKICKMTNLKFNLFDIVKKSFIDGQLIFHCSYNKDTKNGIQKIQMIDPVNFYWNKEKQCYEYLNRDDHDMMLYVDIPYDIDELKYSREEIVRVDFGLHEDRLNLSYLEFAIKPANMLRTLEDLLIPMRFSRSISRRVFNIDVGDLPNKRAKEVMQEIQREFKYKKFYNNETGEVSNQQHITSMVEDYWFANRSGGKGTTVDVLDETGNLGEIGDILYFAKKLYRALNIPLSRLYLDDSSDHTFDYETTSTSKEDISFFMYISRLRKVYIKAFKEILKRQIISQKIMTEDEWNMREEDIKIFFTNENSFIEKMKLDNFTKCMDIYNNMQEQQGKIISIKQLMKRIFRYSDQEIEDMLKEIDEEKKNPLFKKFYEMQQDDF